jgi:hypothetical protein
MDYMERPSGIAAFSDAAKPPRSWLSLASERSFSVVSFSESKPPIRSWISQNSMTDSVSKI